MIYEAVNQHAPQRSIHMADYALVLVENEVTFGGLYDHWNDVTGVHYQFPNTYRNRVRPGTPFVYYRGVRRRDGKRGNAEYFGSGYIGEVWLDPDTPEDTPKRHRHWFCAIGDYITFPNPVPAKVGDQPIEPITGREWQTGVRKISKDVYDRILQLAYERHIRERTNFHGAKNSTAKLVDVSDVVAARPAIVETANLDSSNRRSKWADEIGQLGERLVFLYLQQTLSDKAKASLNWVSQGGAYPGWDMEYVTENGKLIAIEVKATDAARFSSIEVTANEWKAAIDKRGDYTLALVAGVRTEQPRLALLVDPADLALDAKWIIAPTAYKLTRIS